jgi:uncharacterized protein YkwD
VSSTVEVTPARRHSRARFLVLIPLLPALAALAFVATVPLSSVKSDLGAQSLPVTIAQPAAAPVEVTPAIFASPLANASEAQIFSAPPITVLPPPPPPVAKRSSGRISGQTVTSGRCSVGGITVRSVSSAPYSSYEQENFGYINDDRAAEGVGALSWSGSLANAARAWATYLADNNCTGSEIGHSTLWKNGENLYWISGGAGSGLAARANTAFMNSTGHHANLVRATFQSVGVGIAHGPGGWYLVQNFSN